MVLYACLNCCLRSCVCCNVNVFFVFVLCFVVLYGVCVSVLFLFVCESCLNVYVWLMCGLLCGNV